MNDAKEQLRHLKELQNAIAAGTAPEPKDRKNGDWHWHPRIMRLGLRHYGPDRGTWFVKYPTARGITRTFKIGACVVTTLTAAEGTAKDVLADVRQGKDPVLDRKALREKPKLSARKLCDDFLADQAPGSPTNPDLSPSTWYNYQSMLKNHLGGLAQMQVDDLLTPDGARVIADHIRDIVKQHSVHVALHFKRTFSSVFNWANDARICSHNPVVGMLRKLKAPKAKKRSLSIAELGAIWRAAEVMFENNPPRFNGNVRGGSIPVPANSVRADETLLTLAEASRQSGLHKAIFDRAVNTGEIKCIMRRELPSEEHPLKIKQGYHRRTYLISGAELRRFTESRLLHMRSPQQEYATIIRLLVLFGGRYMEMGGLRRSDVDLDKAILHIKTISGDGQRRIKSHGGQERDLMLPMPQIAVDLLRPVIDNLPPGRDHLFGSSRNVLTAVTKKPSGLIQNDRLKGELDEIIARNEGAPLEKWSLHELRHTLTTQMNEMGVDPRIIETITNHRKRENQASASAPRYNHAKYADPMKQTLDAWAQVVLDTANGVESDKSKVVPLFGRSAQTA
jgi:integrase